MEHSKSNPRKPGCYNRCIRSYLWSYYTHRQALAVAGYHAGTHWCSEKCRVSMVLAPNICLYNTYTLVYELHLKHECQYNTYLIRVMPRVIAISGPIKPTGGGSCRISHWFPSVHWKTGPTGRAWLVPDSIPAPIAPPDNPGY